MCTYLKEYKCCQSTTCTLHNNMCGWGVCVCVHYFLPEEAYSRQKCAKHVQLVYMYIHCIYMYMGSVNFTHGAED